MERNREARRTTMAATNGLSRRRQRSSSLRDTPEEDGQVDLPEAARLRERGNKRERDRDLSNRKKRRSGEGFVQSGNEEGEESSEESVDDEEEYEEDDRAAWVIPPLTASSSSTSSHNNRRSFPPAAARTTTEKVGRQTPVWKVTEEMIGVPVPRKARSASTKRSHHEYWISGGGGGEQNHRQLSTSPAGRSIDTVSPFASSPSVRKKMKPTGPKSRPPKVSKSSSATAHDEMDELEVAEVLFGLKKQSQCSKNRETNSVMPQKLDSKDSNGVVHDIKPSVSSVSSPTTIPTQKSPQSSTLPQSISPSSKPVLGVAPKRKKLQAENPSNSDQDVAVKVDIEQSAKMEISSPKLEQISRFSDETSEASNLGASQAASMSLEPHKQAIKPEELKPLTKESGGSQDGIVANEKPVLPKGSITKLDVDLEDSTERKRISTVSEVERRQEEKFKIDLMAPPPMALSPERDDLTGLVSDPKLLAHDVEMKKEILMKAEEKVEKTVKKEAVGESIEEKKTVITGDKRESPRPYLDKEHESGDASGTKLQQHAQEQQSSPKASIIPKEEKTAQSSSLALPISVAGWPGGLPPLGYMPPLVSMDGSSGSSTAVQPPHFSLSIPRPKRCATHQYIARNIFYHRQLTRMNPFWPTAASSASLYGGAKPYNLNFMPPTENMILRKPLQGGFPGACVNSKQGKGQGATTVPGHTGKDKSPEATNLKDVAQKKQLVIQQAPQPVQPGNLLHAPAFIIPLSQHQAAVAATSNPSGPAKSATSSAKTSLSTNSAAGAPVSSSSLPAVVGFNYPNLPANDAPYLAILQNNGYPFPISTHVGVPPPLRAGTQAQAMPCYNGTFYSSQMFHPSQLHQQQPQSQPLAQQANQNTSASSGSSSSNKHPQTQQLRGTQISGNNFLTSTTMQSQLLQKQHVPSSHHSRKRDVELCGENTHSAVDAQASHGQKNVYGQNFAVPVPPVNFALVPSATLGGGGNPGEKQSQHQSQQQALKGGVELIPSQAFAMSFASFNGGNTASGINFSSMAQNPVIFQTLSDMARHGYQVAPAAQMTQQKNYQISEGKTGGDSNNSEDGRKTIPGKSLNVGQSFNICKPGPIDPSISMLMGTTVFDGSTRTLNFVSPPANLNRPSRTTTGSMAANGPSQQQQLIQLQKQHAIGGGRTKVPTSSNQPSSSITTKFPNNHSLFPQNLVQSVSSVQSSLWKNSARTPASQVPVPSLAATTSAIKNLPQQQGRAQQGRTQISFGGSPRSTSAPSPFVAGSPTNSSISNTTGGSLRTTPMSSKAGPSIPMLQPQPADNSSSSPSQKSSPVCGRNVPSILSTCPSHLSEVKY